MTPIIKPTGRKMIATIAPIILFAILAFGSVQLKSRDLVGDTALVSLIGLSLLSAFILHFQDRIKEIAWTGVKLRKAVQEVKDAEGHVRDLASAMLELTEANEGGFKQSTWDSTRYERAKKHLASLVG
jgi:hypothetical protein